MECENLVPFQYSPPADYSKAFHLSPVAIAFQPKGQMRFLLQPFSGHIRIQATVLTALFWPGLRQSPPFRRQNLSVHSTFFGISNRLPQEASNTSFPALTKQHALLRETSASPLSARQMVEN